MTCSLPEGNGERIASVRLEARVEKSRRSPWREQAQIPLPR